MDVSKAKEDVHLKLTLVKPMIQSVGLFLKKFSMDLAFLLSG